MPAFTYPLAWIAAITLPTLAAIYFLRHRFRRQQVSSLLLWQIHQESREGGRRVEKPRWPLVFFLELIVLTLLILAATGPRWQVPHTTRPLIVVLDDSQSMLAGPEGERPRDLALEKIREITQERSFRSYQLIAAGSTPRLLGDKVRHWKELETQFKRWTCQSPEAKLDGALGLARAIGHQEADLLVLTDEAPERPPSKGRLKWVSLGTPRINFAFINAARTVNGGEDRVLLEIANPSATSGTNTLQITAGTNVLFQQTLALETNRTRRLTLPLPSDTPGLKASLGPDALAGDNQVNLLPPKRSQVRVRINVENKELNELISESLQSTGLRAPDNTPPELVIHQSDSVPAGKNVWGLRWLPAPKEPERFTGPFVIDANHPLTRGLSLPGIVWGAHPGATNAPGYRPVITAGNTPLLTHRPETDGRQQISLRYIPNHSTLHTTHHWPALFWNLLDWRTQSQPGLREANHRLGSDVPYRQAGKEIDLKSPNGKTQKIDAPGDEIRLPINLPGIYEISSGSGTNLLSETFAVNFLAGKESDLSRAATGQWGQWGTENEIRMEYASILPYLVLLALAFMVWHVFCIAKQGGRV